MQGNRRSHGTTREGIRKMRIESLRIQNFRCFEDRTFTLDDRFTLLIGKNATGKTAILDAMAVALGAALIPVPRATGVSILRQDVRHTFRPAGETGYWVEHYPTSITARGTVAGADFDWTRELKAENSRTTRVGAKAIRGAMNGLVRRSSTHEDVLFPFIGYYGTARLWLEQRLATRRSIDPAKPGSRYAGYSLCLTPSSSARRMVAWVKRLALIQAQEGRRLATLEAVYRAIAKNVEDAVSASFDFREDDIVVEFEDHRRFRLRTLSDGQRSMAATVADIAMRCSQLNPHLNEHARTETPGVVLIDEIDLHLHPRWQRGVVDALIETFPKLQFVATTHSPFIVQSLDRGGLINLDTGNAEPETPEQQSIEDVTEDIMGVQQPQRSRRFRDMVAAAEEYLGAIQGSEAAKGEDLTALRDRLDSLEEPFADNPAYVAFLRLQRSTRNL